MKIHTKLYDLYSDIISENFVETETIGVMGEGRRLEMYECNFFPYKSAVNAGKYIALFNPTKKKWFALNSFKSPYCKTTTHINLYELSLKDDELFDTAEEAIKQKKKEWDLYE